MSLSMVLRPFAAALLACALVAGEGGRSPHRFELGKEAFLLDGRPFQLRCGEIHPARIPPEYWAHRLRMVKAMGCNAVALYVFWNHHEPKEGAFDFHTGSRDLPRFLRLAQQEGLYVVLRPGPYTCAEWDFGGLPPYLLKIPDIKLRCRDPRYMAAARRYIHALAPVLRPFQVSRGGPLLLLQVENEYGSYGNDRAYLQDLGHLWRREGISLPFYTADGPAPAMLEAGTLPGAAVGLDSGSEEAHWDLARRINPGVPVFSSETYPGWLTHWGEAWARPSQDELLAEVGFLLDHRKSFSLYILHGGTNFGFTAGANSGGNGYEPDVTSYDYDAPIDEQGRPTAKYDALRALMARHSDQPLPPLPDPIPTTHIPPFALRPYRSLWSAWPAGARSPQPLPMEAMGQFHGLMLYRTRLKGHHEGELRLRDLHDFATVFVDGHLVGTVDRRLGETGLKLPQTTSAEPLLEILVEAMGHINFAEHLVDRKGITDRVTLNGMTLMDWEMAGLPLDESWVDALKAEKGAAPERPGRFFEGEFELTEPADTFLDLGKWRKGLVWVNGHNLGRYWDIGPQKRLYCPAPWLRRGRNRVLVMDLLQTEPQPIEGHPEMNR